MNATTFASDPRAPRASRLAPGARAALALALGLAPLAACGDNLTATTSNIPDAAGGGPADAPGTPDAAAFTEAPHPDQPTVVSSGGAVMKAPHIIPIFFTGDDTMQASIEAFHTALVGSSYWTATTSEYGVGALSVGATIVATDTPPTTDTALTAWLASQTDGTHAGWPAPDANTLYAVFLPAGVTLTGQSGTSCKDYGAYHDEIAGKNGKFSYALMPRCQGGLDELTVSASHEYIEAATDPLPQTAGAYQSTDDAHAIWSFTPGGEVGDMCEYLRSASQRLVGTYLVQRTWSNVSAAAGHDPCVPVLSTPYVGANPVLDQDINLGMGFMTKGVKVAMNAPATVEVDLFSDGKAADWTVSAIDVASKFQGTAAELSFAWDKTTGNNGDKLHLTITRLQNGQYGASEFLIVAKDATTTRSLYWGLAAN